MNKNASGAEASTKPSDTDKLYENREPKTIIRLVTVGAYMLSVSFVALVLSGYYIFLWHPPNPRLIHAHAAHLKANSEMEFLVADSLLAIETNKSSRIEDNDILKETEANDRYKYILRPLQDNIQNHKSTDLMNDSKEKIQNDELKKDTVEINTILQRKNITIEKTTSRLEQKNSSASFFIHNQTVSEVPLLKEKESIQIQADDFSTNSIIYKAITMKPTTSTSKRKVRNENSTSGNKELTNSKDST